MEETLVQSTDNTFKKYIPIITALCCTISIILFIGINFEGKLDNWDAYRIWGAPSLIDIFTGDYWGLITTNFVHVELWHIAFNLFWLWRFGKKIEFETNKAFYLFFILSSALVSSLAQLAFSDTTGIGLSGIGYGLFGYLYVKDKTAEEYKNYLDKNTVGLFIFWLVLCVILTKIGIWTVANAAHIGGLLWGALIAYTSKHDKYIRWGSRFIYMALLTILIFHGPFSTSYLSYKAYELHRSQKVDEAIEAYRQILKRDPDNEFAKENLRRLRPYQVKENRIDLH
jgi:membrane associated rhomboid family serine protease